MRHAKSAYPRGVADHDRGLAPRGVADAKAAGRWIREQLPDLDHVVVSTARRARGTWTVAAGEVGYIGAAGYDMVAAGPLTVDPRLYDASPEEMLTVVRELPARVHTAVVVAHMPGVLGLAELLAGSAEGDAYERMQAKFATSAIAILEHELPWSELSAGTARLTDFVVSRGELD